MNSPLPALLLTLPLASYAHAAEQVQGQGGRLLHYSSTQTRSDLNHEEQNHYRNHRDHQFNGANLAAVLQAAQQALRHHGYSQIEAEPDYHVIRALKHEQLVSRGRQVLRGILKLKLPMPGKPDHQSTELLLMLRPGSQSQQVLARARLETTVWDSNGNSHTRLDSDPDDYRQLYSHIDAALRGR